MKRSYRVIVGMALAAAVAAPPAAQAQSLGTFKWQLQPYCNVVAVTITQQGGVYALDGVDDQCGGPQAAAASGTAFLNPDGTIGLGFSIVPSPSGAPVTVDASISVSTLSGSWRDSAGHAGTFSFAPGGGTGGAPRPVVSGIGGIGVGSGLTLSTGANATLAVDPTAIKDIVKVRDTNSSFGLGRDALKSAKSDAFDNTALGASALEDTTVGDRNTAVGVRALRHTAEGSGNTALGWNALGDNISGADNVAIGGDSLERVVISNGNTAIGDAALFQLQLGNNNIGIGQQAGFGLVAGSFNTYIGANGQNLDNYTTRIGGNGPQYRTFLGGIRGNKTGIANAVPVVIDSSGQLGTINSSRRFKEDIEALGPAGEAVLKLRPVQFRYTAPYADGSKPLQYGLIAEEVAEVLPELVSRSADGQIETVQYHLLPTLLLAQVRRLERERATLAERLAALEQEMASVRGQVAARQ
jgi:hypothetical protein